MGAIKKVLKFLLNSLLKKLIKVLGRNFEGKIS